MGEDLVLFVNRLELEFIKNEVVEAVSDARVAGDKEWLILFASKLINACKEADESARELGAEEKAKGTDKS